MQLSCAITAYLTAHRGIVSPKTLRIYRQSLDQVLAHLGDRSTGQITLDDLRAFRAALFDRRERYAKNTMRPRECGPLSPWTIHGHIRVVRQLFRWLAEEQKIDHNPAARLELPELGNEPPKGITESDLKRMLDYAELRSARDYALVMFVADTAARLGGVTGLCLTDLQLRRGRAVVREKGRHGRCKARIVYLTPPTCSAMRAWLKERDQHPMSTESERIFIGNKGALTADGIYLVFRRIAQRAGIKGRFNPHSLRHGLARAMLERGADLARVSQILGHSSIVVTARFYAVFADHELKKAHDQFSWLASRNEPS